VIGDGVGAWKVGLRPILRMAGSSKVLGFEGAGTSTGNCTAGLRFSSEASTRSLISLALTVISVIVLPFAGK
jgi:hypothetical protein